MGVGVGVAVIVAMAVAAGVDVAVAAAVGVAVGVFSTTQTRSEKTWSVGSPVVYPCSCFHLCGEARQLAMQILRNANPSLQNSYTTDRTAAHRKSDRRRVYLFLAELRKRAS